jgi:peptidoglycan/xylan/chitin deacetylase (PgdA/CDA1 family)
MTLYNVRFDRFMTLHVFRPLLRLKKTEAVAERIPILMYHSISDEIDHGANPYFRTVTSPVAFERQMRFLSECQYRVVSLTQACLKFRESTSEGRSGRNKYRPVVITFDDGFQDVFRIAVPIMQRYGFTASVFLSTDYIGRQFINGRRCLSESEVRQMVAGGFHFGSHTVSHPQLRTLSHARIADELAVSKRRIEELTGAAATHFSYPYRFPEEDSLFVRDLGNMLTQAGYTAGVTTSIGRARIEDSPLFMKRLPINDCDDRELFEAKLNGAYDWLHRAQLAYKRLRAAISH